MRFLSLETDKLTGHDLKRMIDSPKGVLVLDGHNLYFVSTDDMSIRVLRGIPNRIKTKITFISDKFDNVKDLKDNVEYRMDFSYIGLEFWDVEKKEIDVYVSGIVI